MLDVEATSQPTGMAIGPSTEALFGCLTCSIGVSDICGCLDDQNVISKSRSLTSGKPKADRSKLPPHRSAAGVFFVAEMCRQTAVATVPSSAISCVVGPIKVNDEPLLRCILQLVKMVHISQHLPIPVNDSHTQLLFTITLIGKKAYCYPPEQTWGRSVLVNDEPPRISESVL